MIYENFTSHEKNFTFMNFLSRQVFFHQIYTLKYMYFSTKITFVSINPYFSYNALTNSRFFQTTVPKIIESNF